MLIKAERLKTSSGCARLVQHLDHGDENDQIVAIQGVTRDLEDAVADARNFARVYSLSPVSTSPSS
jgi:hypothetical protein